MQETTEFRIDENYVSRLFSEIEGKRLGTEIRKIEIATNDPRYPRIGEMQKEVCANTRFAFFYGWHIQRRYAKAEIASALCFQLIVSSYFEPSGEECGTQYDDSTACPACGTGATQVSDLRLDLRKVPKKRHIALSIADECIVSQYLAERMVDAGLTGFGLRPVRHKAKYEDDPIDLSKVPTGREILRLAELAGAPRPTGKFWVWINRSENRELFAKTMQENAAMLAEKDKRRGKPLPVWYQLIVTSANAEIVSPTRVGLDPFDDDVKGECRCPEGDLIGLNVLSEVSISANTLSDVDISCSRQYVGVRRGVLRPRRLMFISQKFRKFLEAEKITGTKIEVVHLV